MKYSDINDIEKATRVSRREMARFGFALLLIIAVMLIVDGMHLVEGQGHLLLVIAAMIGGYMAMNIGANDVANNVGPAVGARAITLTGAIIIATIFESAGAIIAGGEVVSTIKNGIIDPKQIADVELYIYAMLAALLAAAIWLNLATAMGAPVSTTHSIVGAVLGVGFLREYLKTSYAQAIQVIREHHDAIDADKTALDAYMQRFEKRLLKISD